MDVWFQGWIGVRCMRCWAVGQRRPPTTAGWRPMGILDLPEEVLSLVGRVVLASSPRDVLRFCRTCHGLRSKLRCCRALAEARRLRWLPDAAGCRISDEGRTLTVGTAVLVYQLSCGLWLTNLSSRVFRWWSVARTSSFGSRAGCCRRQALQRGRYESTNPGATTATGSGSASATRRRAVAGACSCSAARPWWSARPFL